MEIKLIDDGLMIVPETKFEEDYLTQFQNEKLKSFVKTGSDLTDVIGLKIIRKEKKNGIRE